MKYQSKPVLGPYKGISDKPELRKLSSRKPEHLEGLEA
jgi:hypothetical protein